MNLVGQALRFGAAAVALSCAIIAAFRTVRRGEADRHSAEKNVLVLGIVLHLLIMGYRAYVLRFFPLVSISDVLVFLSLLIVVFCRATCSRQRDSFHWMRACACVVSAIAVAISALIHTPAEMPLELRSAMLPVHVAGAVIAYACFTFNVVLCIHLLFRTSFSRASDTNEQFGRVCAMTKRFALAGWVLYAVFVMIMGMVWAKMAWGRYWGWDPKETLSLAAFCAYSLYVYFEIIIKPRSRVLLGFLSAVAYLTLILTVIFGMRVAGLHSYG